MIQSAQYFAMALVVSVAAAQDVHGAPIKVAVVQTVVEDTVDANRKKFLRFIEDAGDAGCRLVVFPENSLYWPERSRETPSKAKLDAAIETICSAAKDHGVYVAFGTAYRNSETARFRNRAIVFGPRGEQVMAYWKSSEVPPSFDVDGVPCNLLICSDRWYLEMSELPCLVNRTKLIIDISGGHGGDDGRPDLPLIRYRPWAVRTGAWVIVSNPVHDDTDFMGNSPWGGGSAIIRPDGSVMFHRRYDKDVMIVAEVDPSLADREKAERRRNHSLLGPFWHAGGILLREGRIEAVPDIKPLPSVARDVRIAVAQMACSNRVSTNTKQVLHFIRRAANAGADIVVFPELALTGTRREFIQAVDQVTLGNALQTIQHEARACTIHVVLGAPFVEDGRMFNGAMVIGDDGRLKTRYSQIATGLDDVFHAGTSIRSMWFDLKGIPAIVTIGDDANWIEIGDLAACRGMSLHFHLSNEADASADAAVLRKQMNLVALSYAQFGAVANAAMPHASGGSLIVNREGGHNQPAPAGLEYYLPYQTSIVASAPKRESLLIATRRLAANNRMDWDTHSKNRGRRFRKQAGWDEWIKQGMWLIRPDGEAVEDH